MPDEDELLGDDPVCVAAEEYNADLRRQRTSVMQGPTPPAPPLPTGE